MKGYRTALLCLLLCAARVVGAEVEIARIRVTLLPGGTIGVSRNGGQDYTIIGRITALPSRLTTGKQPAATASLQPAAAWFIQHNEQQGVRLVPAGTKDAFALITDLPRDSLLFNLPLEGCTVRLLLQEGRVAYSMPPGYRYKIGGVWVIQVLATDDSQQAKLHRFITERLPAESRQAIERSLARAQREKLPVVNGVLNLEVTAKFAENVKFVFFSVDGTLLGTSNVLPTVFRWNSTQVPDGEYVIEARAVDADNRELALVRKRVLVRNATTP